MAQVAVDKVRVLELSQNFLHRRLLNDKLVGEAVCFLAGNSPEWRELGPGLAFVEVWRDPAAVESTELIFFFCSDMDKEMDLSVVKARRAHNDDAFPPDDRGCKLRARSHVNRRVPSRVGK